MVESLQRRLGMADAVVLGLGAMLGTGVFTAVGPAAGAAGRWLLLSLLLAAVVATCNALSSAASALADLTAVVRIGAAVATVSVLLSVLVGVSRTTLAMARGGNLPTVLATIGRRGTPWRADLAGGAVAALDVLPGVLPVLAAGGDAAGNHYRTGVGRGNGPHRADRHRRGGNVPGL